ncbi:MAG: HAMP domain-containing histidine kinase [Bacteroidetes bacterium]|nr:HAMP domain-containing histidine kinase [Bacteroidota bacterium]
MQLANMSNNEKMVAATPLHQFVEKILNGLQSGISLQTSAIINDVHPDIQVTTDNEMLASVLSRLIHNSLTYSENSTIRISAKHYSALTLIHVKTSHAHSGITLSVGQIQPLAEKIGGCISVSNNKDDGITLTLTFLNNLAAA